MVQERGDAFRGHTRGVVCEDADRPIVIRKRKPLRCHQRFISAQRNRKTVTSAVSPTVRIRARYVLGKIEIGPRLPWWIAGSSSTTSIDMMSDQLNPTDDRMLKGIETVVQLAGKPHWFRPAKSTVEALQRGRRTQAEKFHSGDSWPLTAGFMTSTHSPRSSGRAERFETWAER